MSPEILVVWRLLASLMSPGLQQQECEPPVWGDTVTVFSSRVQAYADLRDRLQAGLRQPVATDSLTELRSNRQTLAARIRKARANAKQGDLFSDAIAEQIKRSLRRAIDAHTWMVIMDDNPGEQPSQVNVEYREGSPLTTMPPNILAALPTLPGGVEYRFVERHLILLDTRALIIVDRIPFAIVDPASQGSCKLQVSSGTS
ncbi:MAG TPA: hypothetical protein VH138_04050 [Vicinamibacterales bacterium]|nr:hypothetical protein [Vicinamibacterales bacterium]